MQMGWVVGVAFQFGPHGHFTCGPIRIWSPPNFSRLGPTVSLAHSLYIYLHMVFLVHFDVPKAEAEQMQTPGNEKGKNRSPKNGKPEPTKMQTSGAKRLKNRSPKNVKKRSP
jgi:hypothetical protein